VLSVERSQNRVRDLTIHRSAPPAPQHRGVEDRTALQTFRDELAELLERVDRRIAAEAAASALTPDEVRLRKLENATTWGRNIAHAEGYASAADEADFVDLAHAYLDGDRQLVANALSAAREIWRSRAA
jgi:hypothetical protein